MREKPPQLWTDEFFQAVNPRVNVAGFHQATPGWYGRMKRPILPDFDLWYNIAGRGAVRLDGRRVDIGPGDLLLMRPGQCYDEEWADRTEPFQSYFVHFWPFGDAHAPLNAPLARAWPTLLNAAAPGRLADLFAELFEAWTARHEGYRMAVKAAALQIFLAIFAVLRRGPETRPPPGYANFQRACDLLAARYADDLSLDALAEQVDLSASYLAALFKRYTGQPPVHYLIDLRLRAARTLLARGQSVSEVAAQVGFHSLHYFSRTFRRRTGLTPTEFAARARRK
jgi:AraC-like DNA-binding protein